MVAFIAKYDSTAKYQWAINVADNAYANSLVTDKAGNVFVGGFTALSDISYNLYIGAYNSNGDSLWTKQADSACVATVTTLSLDAADNIYVGGYFTSNTYLDGLPLIIPPGVTGDYSFLAKLTDLPTDVPIIKQPDASYMLYPNPATNEINITGMNKITQLTICNLLGQTLYDQSCNDTNITINVADLPPGVYFVKVNNSITKKFVKE